MLKAVDYANFFIDLANSSDDDYISNLRLNKLLYFAQGYSLYKRGMPLFDDEIEAWKYGPVVPSVYRTFKVCGRGNIDETYGDYNVENFSSDELEILLNVAEEFGKYSSPKLVDITHAQGSPWQQVFNEDAKHTIISKKSIADYFRDKMKLSPFNYDDVLALDVIGYRNEDGNYVLPKEYDEA